MFNSTGKSAETKTFQTCVGIDAPYCPLNVQHILLECTLYRNERQGLVASCMASGTRLTLASLLGNSDSQIIDALFIYLRR